mgnify:CR=1 FL=1
MENKYGQKLSCQVKGDWRKQGLSEHTAPFDAVVHILDGTAEITIGGKPQIVNAGEMLIMPANVSHALQAKQRFKMLLVMIRSD